MFIILPRIIVGELAYKYNFLEIGVKCRKPTTNIFDKRFQEFVGFLNTFYMSILYKNVSRLNGRNFM